MRRKRRRTRPRWKPILSVLLVGNVIAGLLWSPVTSLRRVRVEGAADFDQLRIAAILADLKGVPCAQVKARNVESLVLDLPEAESAELTRNLFGGGLLRVAYHRPVARLFNQGNLALTMDGVLYEAHDLPPDLPTIQLRPDEPAPSLGLNAGWQPAQMARLAVQAKQIAPQGPVRVGFNNAGEVCLNMGSGLVVLGSLEDLDRKLQVLRDRLERNPLELSQVESLNLVAPESPSVVPKKVESQP